MIKNSAEKRQELSVLLEDESFSFFCFIRSKVDILATFTSYFYKKMDDNFTTHHNSRIQFSLGV